MFSFFRRENTWAEEFFKLVQGLDACHQRFVSNVESSLWPATSGRVANRK